MCVLESVLVSRCENTEQKEEARTLGRSSNHLATERSEILEEVGPVIYKILLVWLANMFLAAKVQSPTLYTLTLPYKQTFTAI